MEKKKIEFQEQRDVGQVLTTTFTFIKIHYKVLFKGITFFAMPFILLSVILLYSSFSGISDFITGINDQIDSVGQLLFFILQIFIAFIVFALGMVMFITTVNECVKLSTKLKAGETISMKELWVATRKYFWWNLLNVFIWYLMSTVVGMVLYFILLIFALVAGIGGATTQSVIVGVILFIFILLIIFFLLLYYISTSLPIFFIATYEKINIFNAIGRSFSLFHQKKKNFWSGIWLNFLSSMIVLILRYATSLPVILIFAFIYYNSGKMSDFMEGSGMFKSFIIVFSIIRLTTPYFMVIPFIANAIKYFDMTEQVEGRGVRKKIELIGKTKDFDPLSYQESQ